jgi:hypothetical protein
VLQGRVSSSLTLDITAKMNKYVQFNQSDISSVSDLPFTRSALLYSGRCGQAQFRKQPMMSFGEESGLADGIKQASTE